MAKSKKTVAARPAAKKKPAKKSQAPRKTVKKSPAKKKAAKKKSAPKRPVRKPNVKKQDKSTLQAVAAKIAIPPGARFVPIIDLEDPGPEYEFCLVNGRQVLVLKGTCHPQDDDGDS